MKDEDPVKIERKVEEVRDNLTGIASELDRRRHEVFDLKLQLRRHGLAIGLCAAAVAALVGGSVGLTAWSRARRARLMSRAHRLRVALARMIAHPDDVARPAPNVGKKVAAAVVSAAAGVAAKAVAQRLATRTKTALPN